MTVLARAYRADGFPSAVPASAPDGRAAPAGEEPR
jgi:hypothetical protein